MVVSLWSSREMTTAAQVQSPLTFNSLLPWSADVQQYRPTLARSSKRSRFGAGNRWTGKPSASLLCSHLCHHPSEADLPLRSFRPVRVYVQIYHQPSASATFCSHRMQTFSVQWFYWPIGSNDRVMRRTIKPANSLYKRTRLGDNLYEWDSTSEESQSFFHDKEAVLLRYIIRRHSEDNSLRLWNYMSTLLQGRSCNSQNPTFAAENYLRCRPMTKKLPDVRKETERSTSPTYKST